MEPAPPSTLADELVRFIDDHVSSGGPGDVAVDTDLVMTGLVDSLGVVMIVEWLEARLDLTIDPGDVVIEHFGSVAAIIDFLRARDDCAAR